jgi:methyl-accepting chemotaxis protein
MEVNSLAKEELPAIQLVNHVLKDTLTYRILTNRHVLTDNESEKRVIDGQCDEIAQSILKQLQDYGSYINSAEEKTIADRIVPALDAFRVVAKQIRTLSHEQKDAEALALLKGEGAKTFATFEESVKNCVDNNDRSALAMANGVTADAGRNLTITLYLSLSCILAAIVAGFFITRGINRSLQQMAGSLDDASSQVAAAAGQVSSSSQGLAEGASEQAASLEETSSSLEELSSMTKRNADSAQSAKVLSGETRGAAETGNNDMTEMRSAMDAIKASSSDIAKIIKTIDEIAFQTNILALNAAVEAARAGEAGAGFAVVAEEVRALAQRSATAAKETADKIEDSIAKSDHGAIVSGKVAASLGVIVEKARKVDELVAGIANASNEQNVGIGQINAAVSQMDKVTQSNAGSAEETAAAAEELSAQSVSLKEIVGQLHQMIGGSSNGKTVTEDRPVDWRPAAPAKVTAARPAYQAVAVASGTGDDFFKDA